jgi:hypothetical protein
MANGTVVIIEQWKSDEIACPGRLRKSPLHLFFGRNLTRCAGFGLSRGLLTARSDHNPSLARRLLGQSWPRRHTEQDGQRCRFHVLRHA